MSTQTQRPGSRSSTLIVYVDHDTHPRTPGYRVYVVYPDGSVSQLRRGVATIGEAMKHGRRIAEERHARLLPAEGLRR